MLKISLNELSKLVLGNLKKIHVTVSTNFYSDIKKYDDKSAFVKVEPQTFALRGSAEIPSNVGSVSVKVKEVSKLSLGNSGFSFTNCAREVFQEFGGKNPMHYNEIMWKALN